MSEPKTKNEWMREALRLRAELEDERTRVDAAEKEGKRLQARIDQLIQWMFEKDYVRCEVRGMEQPRFAPGESEMVKCKECGFEMEQIKDPPEELLLCPVCDTILDKKASGCRFCGAALIYDQDEAYCPVCPHGGDQCIAAERAKKAGE